MCLYMDTYFSLGREHLDVFMGSTWQRRTDDYPREGEPDLC